ncbi:unnamed protein product [Heterobilharzia americana]|nr:unnamed protein product [Heterobilharzia americana]
MDVKNPWEDFIFDQSVDNINESPDCFNSIKLSDFPFLKSQFSTIDYLIKCEICNVILLPESISMHYGDRHSESSKSISAVLPYEAVSWCECQAEIGSKKDRASKRTKVAPIKHNKRTVNSTVDTTLGSSKVGKPRASDGVREREKTKVEKHEELREPVLLKLAKSDGRVVQDNELPRKAVKVSVEKKISERSIWSVVCSKEHPSSSSYGELTHKSQFEQSRHSSKDMFECGSGFNHSNDSGIGSQTQSVLHCSSYPPTPSLSPHLPSSSPSNVSDDTILGFSQFRPEVPNRPVSRSSHSSSSSGIGLFEQHPISDPSSTLPTTVVSVNNAKTIGSFALSDIRSMGKCKIRSKLPTVCLQNNRIFGSTSSQAMFAKEALPEMALNSVTAASVFSLKNSHQEADCETVKNEMRRNGFHGWVTDERPTSSETCRSDNIRRLMAIQRLSTPSRNQRILLNQTPRYIKGVHFTPTIIPQYYQAEHSEGRNTSTSGDSNRFIQPSIILQPEKSCKPDLLSDGSSQTSWPDPSGIMTDTDELQEFLEDLDDTFDPMTQCGCLELDDIKCKNSVLCTVHTIDEKLRVPRQHDLRYLMREAKRRQQILRQVPNASCHQFPWIMQASRPLVLLLILLTKSVSAIFPSHDIRSHCSVFHNTVNTNGPADMRFISNKFNARLHQRNKPVVIAQPCAVDFKPQTDVFLSSCSAQASPTISTFDVNHFPFNPVGSESVLTSEYFTESSTSNMPLYMNNKQISGNSTSYPNARLTNEPQYSSQRICLSSSQPAQIWASRLTRHPVEGSAATTINLDNLISSEDLSSEEAFAEPSFEINLPRKLHVPIAEQLPPSTVVPTTLFPQLSFSSRKFQESQGRVIVNDMREKCITGRNRKTARATYRPSGSSTIQGPTLTSLLHLRNQQTQQQSQFQPISGFIGGCRVSSAEHIPPIRAAIVNKTRSTSSITDILNCKMSSSSVFESQEKMDMSVNTLNPQLVYSPSLIASNEPCTYVGLSSNYSTSSLTPSTTLSSRISNQVLDCSVDSTLDTLYIPNSLQTCPTTISPSISAHPLHSNSRPIITTFNVPYN